MLGMTCGLVPTIQRKQGDYLSAYYLVVVLRYGFGENGYMGGPLQMKIVYTKSSGIAKRYEFKVYGGHIVKAAYIKRPEKHIICLSTQIGCASNCLFCSTGTVPLIRNLSANEMREMTRQIEVAERILYEPLLVSFMGSGEPLDNIKNVLHVIRHHPRVARFAVSVSGANVDRVMGLPSYVKVQFTLISPFTGERWMMQPSVSPLHSLREIIISYKGPKELNVPLIAGFNDDYKNMRAIAAFSLISGDVPVKLNKFHRVGPFEPSTRAMECLETLRHSGVEAEYYETDGEDIFAACGQFDCAG